MKEILENHRARLTEAEKRALWRTVREEVRRPQSLWLRHRRSAFALAGAAAAIVVTVVTLVGRGTNLEPPIVDPGATGPRPAASPAGQAAGSPTDRPAAQLDRDEPGSTGNREMQLGEGKKAEADFKAPASPATRPGETEPNSRIDSNLAAPPPTFTRSDPRLTERSGVTGKGDITDVASTKTATVYSATAESASSEAKDDGRGAAPGVSGAVVDGAAGGVFGYARGSDSRKQAALRDQGLPDDTPRELRDRIAGDIARRRSELDKLRSNRQSGQSGDDEPSSVGGTDPVNGEPFDAMFFEHAGVNPFVDPREDPLATFAIDVDTASYSLARAYLRRGELPPPAAIRVEEFVNAFPHGYAPPPDRGGERWNDSRRGKAFAIHLDAAPAPFGKDLVLLRVGLKGREIQERDRRPAVLTFVVDVSGSMRREDRLVLVKRALRLLLDEMRPDDRVGLVVYGSEARVVLPHVSLRERVRVERAIESLAPEGSTNAAAGLRQGYALAGEAFRAGAINRIILCSDGVANTGTTDAEDILVRIGTEAKRGIELTTIGFGMGNYNDVLMEKLADRGDGSYHYVDNLDEARRIFVDELTGTLQTIARQVKVQVAFDPSIVRRYRLLGYENRDVADRDFRNDRVDAGEVGAGREVTALFEVSLEDGASNDDLAEVRLRYEEPDGGRVVEMVAGIGLDGIARRFDAAPPSFRRDAAVAEFAEILRHSYWAKDGDLAEVARIARESSRERTDGGATLEFISLVESARRLWTGFPSPEEE